MNKIDLKHTAFIVVKPPSRIISQHKLKTDTEYAELVGKAREVGHCLYSAPMMKRDGKYYATQPWQLHPDTIPQESRAEVTEVVEVAQVPGQTQPDQLCCPFCNKLISSTAGRTLHVKSNHPDKIEEYHKWLKSLGKKSRK